MAVYAALAVAVAVVLLSHPASAHHAMGGEVPATLPEGLLSGLAHPVIGPDHLAFVIGAGMLAGLAGSALSLPLSFVAATLGGTALHLAGLDIPLAELAIGLSVLAAALGVITQWPVSTGLLAALFAVAGMFHGYAYGESVVGAEPAPLSAYLFGFATVQYVIALASGLLPGVLARRGAAWRSAGLRLAGVAIAIIGTATVWNALGAA